MHHADSRGRVPGDHGQPGLPWEPALTEDADGVKRPTALQWKEHHLCMLFEIKLNSSAKVLPVCADFPVQHVLSSNVPRIAEETLLQAVELNDTGMLN